MTEIEITNLSKNFQYTEKDQNKIFEVYNDFNLTINKHEFVSIVGPSGCGKSTLLQMIAGLEKNYKGDIKCATNLNNKNLGYMFQTPRLMPWLTVLENLKICASEESIKNNSPQKYLDKFQLSDFSNTYPNRLSGGMRRKVSIARTFINDHDLILLDEPFTSINLPVANALREDFILKAKESNVTLILVTHDLKEAIMFADKIVFLSPRPAKIIHQHQIAIERPRKLDGDGVMKEYNSILSNFPNILEGKI